MSAIPVFFWLDMTDIDDINDAIADAATGPAEVEIRVDGERVKARSISELIQAATHVASQAAASQDCFGFRTKALKGGGAWQ